MSGGPRRGEVGGARGLTAVVVRPVAEARRRGSTTGWAGSDGGRAGDRQRGRRAAVLGRAGGGGRCGGGRADSVATRQPPTGVEVEGVGVEEPEEGGEEEDNA